MKNVKRVKLFLGIILAIVLIVISAGGAQAHEISPGADSDAGQNGIGHIIWDLLKNIFALLLKIFYAINSWLDKVIGINFIDIAHIIVKVVLWFLNIFVELFQWIKGLF